MNNLKEYSNEDIVKMLEDKEITFADLTDSGICPTCFDRENNFVVFGDNKDKILYEDDDIECFLIGNPRAVGHSAISTKKHYKDMMELDDEMCKKVFLMSKRLMNILKEVYESESVYLCTMCDGPMNHFHVQLIPRYKEEKRGSKSFVKPRMKYKEDKEKVDVIRKKLNYESNND